MPRPVARLSDKVENKPFSIKLDIVPEMASFGGLREPHFDIQGAEGNIGDCHLIKEKIQRTGSFGFFPPLELGSQAPSYDSTCTAASLSVEKIEL